MTAPGLIGRRDLSEYLEVGESTPGIWEGRDNLPSHDYYVNDAPAWWEPRILLFAALTSGGPSEQNPRVAGSRLPESRLDRFEDVIGRSFEAVVSLDEDGAVELAAEIRTRTGVEVGPLLKDLLSGRSRPRRRRAKTPADD